MELKTKFAPAARVPQSEIEKDYKVIKSIEYLGSLLGSITGLAAVLNPERQVVYANEELISFLGMDSVEEALGSRPGEAVSCVHSQTEQGGCGTAEACRYCGAINTILESRSTGKKVSHETRLTVLRGGTAMSLDLQVTAIPFKYGEKDYTIVTFQDISGEKRRAGLERIFFHDSINLAGGINGMLAMLREMEDKNDGTDLIDHSEKASAELLEEIISFKQLKQAENGDLAVNMEPVNSMDILFTAAAIAGNNAVAHGRKVKIDESSARATLSSDRTLLSRILVNMLKNALEATPAGGTVNAGAAVLQQERIRFYVKNSQSMTEEVRMQVFQRSFSTKGKDRGLGTYSMKLLGERYLGGSVWFESSEEGGTTFYIELELARHVISNECEKSL